MIPEELLAMGIASYMLSFVSSILIYIADSLGRYKVYQKAGENAWGAWVPFYKDWIFLKMGKFPGIMAILPAIAIGAYFLLTGILSILGVAISQEVGQVIFLTIGLAYLLFTILTYILSIFSAVAAGAWLQKPGYWAVLYIFFPYVWFLINGFDQSEWKSPKPKIEKFSLEDYMNYNKNPSAEEKYQEPGYSPQVDMTPGPAVASGLAAFLPIEEEPEPPKHSRRRK